MAIPILPILNASTKKLKQRYLSKVIKQDGCWSWTGATTKQGYTKLKASGKDLLGHRVSYALHNEVDPGDLLVCHSCDNPTCTNPAHLFLGTVQDNSDDMAAKGRSRQGPVQEELNPMAIITREQVRYIKLAASIRMANTELARLFGVHHSTISAIKLGKSWPTVLLEEA